MSLISPAIRQVAINLNIGQQAVSQQVPGAQNLATADAGFGKLLSGLLTNVMMLGALLLLAYLLWGGIEWITSGGEKGKVESARGKMTQAVIGMLVLAATMALLSLIQGFLGLCFLKIGGKC